MKLESAGYSKPVAVDWERGIGTAEAHAAGPVRSIPITAAVRAADDRRRQQTSFASDWRKSLGLRPAAEVESKVYNFHIMKQPARKRVVPGS